MGNGHFMFPSQYRTGCGACPLERPSGKVPAQPQRARGKNRGPSAIALQEGGRNRAVVRGVVPVRPPQVLLTLGASLALSRQADQQQDRIAGDGCECGTMKCLEL